MKHALSYLPRIEKAYEAEVVYYKGPINEKGARDLRCAIAETDFEYANTLLILETTSGTVEGARQIADALKGSRGDHPLSLYVPDICVGAGTLLAIAADRLIMDEGGRIGQVSDSSDQELDDAKNTLRGAELVASRLHSVKLEGALIDKLDLLTLGRVLREMELARSFVADCVDCVGNDRNQLGKKLLGDTCHPGSLFRGADLADCISVETPSKQLKEFASYVRWDVDSANLPPPCVMLLNSSEVLARKRYRIAS